MTIYGIRIIRIMEPGVCPVQCNYTLINEFYSKQHPSRTCFYFYYMTIDAKINPQSYHLEA